MRQVAPASDETKMPPGAATRPEAPAYRVWGLLGAATKALTYRLASPVAVVVQLFSGVPVISPSPVPTSTWSGLSGATAIACIGEAGESRPVQVAQATT